MASEGPPKVSSGAKPEAGARLAKLMLTRADRAALHGLGYSDEQIGKMIPQDGADIIEQNLKAGTSESTKPQPEVVAPVELEEAGVKPAEEIVAKPAEEIVEKQKPEEPSKPEKPAESREKKETAIERAQNKNN